MKTLERPTDHEPMAQCPELLAQYPDCRGNGTYTLDQYRDGEFREGRCQTCDGRGSIPLGQYLLPIHEDEILAEEVGA